MGSKRSVNDKKRKRVPETACLEEEEDNFVELKKLKLSAHLDRDSTMHQARSPVNSQSWSSPTSPEPILCDPVSPAPVPDEEEDEFAGYERFNKFLGQIHQESKIHHFRHQHHQMHVDCTPSTSAVPSTPPN